MSYDHACLLLLLHCLLLDFSFSCYFNCYSCGLLGQMICGVRRDSGGHQGFTARALVSKAFRTGFYWPTARADAQDLVQRCVDCQLLANQRHMPPTALKTIPITWPFDCGWAMHAKSSRMPCVAQKRASAPLAKF